MYNNMNIRHNKYIEPYRKHVIKNNGSEYTIHTSPFKYRGCNTDNNLKANLFIRKISDRLNNSASELEAIHEMISSDLEILTER